MKHAQQTAAAAAIADPAKDDEFTRTTVARLLKMRAMLHETRNRSAALQSALELFKYRQSKIDGG